MPQVAIAAAGAALTTGVGYATGAVAASAFLSTLAANVAISVVLSGVSMALAPKPKKPPKVFDTTNIAVRQPAVSRKIVYGQTRIADVYGHIASSNNNEFLHLVIILAGHELTEIGEVWADDYCIPPDWLDADGNVTQGKYAGVMRIRKHLGSPSQAADPFMVNEIAEWTNDHRLQNIAYLYVRMKYDANKFPNGEPAFSAIVKGKKVDDPRFGLGFSTNCALFVNDYLRDTYYGYGALPESIDDENIAAEASIADEIVDTEEKDMTSVSVATATGIITLDGDRLLYELGDRCELVTSGTLPSGLATGTDYYIIPYQFKDTPRIRLATSLQNAMNGVFVPFTTSGSGAFTVRKNGEPRYHGGGVLDSANTLKDNIEAMLASLAGRATNIGGKWTLLSGAWRSPVVSIGENEYRGAFNVQTKIAMSERFNVVKGLFISQLNDYQQADYPQVSSPTFITEDAGVEYPRDLNLAFTNRSDTAQRIAKIELLRARQEITVAVGASLAAMKAQAGDTVNINLPHLGFVNKTFEVISFSFNIGGDGQLNVNLTLRETAEGVYTWTLDEAAAVDPAPNTQLQNVFDILVPTGVAFNSRQIDTRDGDALFSMFLKWDLHPDAFVRQGGGFALQWRRSGDADWQPSFFVDGGSTESFILQSSVNIAYDLRIAARNNLGIQSSWVTLLGAVAGSSGGVSVTNNWQTFQDSVTVSQDFGTFGDTVSVTDDWGLYS